MNACPSIFNWLKCCLTYLVGVAVMLTHSCGPLVGIQGGLGNANNWMILANVNYSWRHQYTTCTIVKLSSNVFCGIHLEPFRKGGMNLIHNIWPEITLWSYYDIPYELTPSWHVLDVPTVSRDACAHKLEMCWRTVMEAYAVIPFFSFYETIIRYFNDFQARLLIISRTSWTYLNNLQIEEAHV